MKLGTNDIGSVYLGTNAVQKVYLGTNEVWSSYAYLLDDYSGAAAAYSLRKLRSAYTGSAIRVRRASDNTEQDIGFVNNELDTSTLSTFCSGTNGFVKTWYDQSGNGNDAEQTTIANQPQIVSSGSVILDNGKPSVQFDGSLQHLINTSQQFITISFVAKITVDTFNMILGDETNLYNVWYSGNTLSFDGNFADEARYSINGSTLSAYAENHTISNYVNSQINLFANYDTSRSMKSQFSNIARYNTTLLFNGVIQEIVVYNSDQSSNRTGIETNINDFYSIY